MLAMQKMDTENQTNSRSSRKHIIQTLMLLFVVSVLASFLYQAMTRRGRSTPLVQLRADARVLVITYLIMKEDYVDPSAPLFAPGLADPPPRYYDKESGRFYDWLYFNPVGNEAPARPLVATPTTVNRQGDVPRKGDNHYRVVGFSDGIVELIEESEFRKMLSQPADAPDG